MKLNEQEIADIEAALKPYLKLIEDANKTPAQAIAYLFMIHELVTKAAEISIPRFEVPEQNKEPKQ